MRRALAMINPIPATMRNEVRGTTVWTIGRQSPMIRGVKKKTGMRWVEVE
jgi:hypothetical protein